MSDLQQRIADILEPHLFSDVTGRCSCDHGESGSFDTDVYRLHLAEVLTSELGLIREWTGNAKTRDAGMRRAEHYEVPLKIRYVTEWAPEPGSSQIEKEDSQ